MSDKLRPLGARVLVRRDPEEKVSEGGIALPDRSTEIPRRGTVLMLGRGRMVLYDEELVTTDDGRKFYDIVPFQVQVGDTVYFNRWGGIEVELDGEKLLIMPEEEILAYTRPEQS